jgi:hypothetical protein
MYFNPAQRPLAPVSAATVTLLNADDARSFDIDVDVKSTADSALIIILRDGVSLDELKPIIGINGAEHVRRSQRDAPANIALPVVEVSAEGNWKPLDRKVTSVLVRKDQTGRAALAVHPKALCIRPQDTVVTARYLVIMPTSSMSLRLRQIVYPVPETRNGRYRVRVNWISFPAERNDKLRFEDSTSARYQADCAFSKAGETAVADDLEAYGRRLSVNWWGGTALGVVLFLAGMAITGS